MFKKKKMRSSFLFFVILFNLLVCSSRSMLLQRGIADEVLRFHVLANSDGKADQEVKLKVRDAVLAWLAKEWEEVDVSESEKNDDGKTKDRNQKSEEEAFLRTHLSDLEAIANDVLVSERLSYRAQATLTTCYFPDRSYGNCTFPAGWYKALRIELGKAKGHNWWCVLYPRLCFTDSLHAVVKEEEMQQLSNVLTEAEYDSLLHEPSRWKFTFRWF